MANLKSSKKDAKRTIVRTARNKARRSELKTLVKKVKSAVVAGDLEKAKSIFVQAQSKIAAAKKKGLLKANTASRKVSRMAKQIAILSK